jgi:disulfide bond formation protein DsbB
MANSVNTLFSVLTILSQLVILWLLFAWLFDAKVPSVIYRHAIALAFAAALLATLGSLTYSEMLGYEPCKLCWLQRIFMYPQVLILGFALWGRHKESRALLDLSLVMSAIGGVIALYHYLMQLGFVPEGSCAAVGYSVSCAKTFVLQFGYITIPMMALSAFFLIILSLRARGRSA